MKKPSISRIQEMEGSSRCIQGAAAYMPRAIGRLCRATLCQGGRSFHGVCLGEDTHCSVSIALEGGETAVEPDVDVLMCGLFSLKLTRYIRKTGEQLLFRAGELLDVGDGFGDRR